jgi:hypothetical protein
MLRMVLKDRALEILLVESIVEKDAGDWVTEDIESAVRFPILSKRPLHPEARLVEVRRHPKLVVGLILRFRRLEQDWPGEGRDDRNQ